MEMLFFALQPSIVWKSSHLITFTSGKLICIVHLGIIFTSNFNIIVGFAGLGFTAALFFHSVDSASKQKFKLLLEAWFTFAEGGDSEAAYDSIVLPVVFSLAGGSWDRGGMTL